MSRGKVARRAQGTTAVGRVERPAVLDSELVLNDGAVKVGLGDRRSIFIDSSKLASPPHSFDADVCWVEHVPPGTVNVFFGKIDRDSPGVLKSRLEVRYPPEDFLRNFWGNSRAFHAELSNLCDKFPRDTKRAELHPETWKSERQHSEWVNFVYIAHAGTQATMEFFNLNPSGVARYARGQGTSGLELRGIVRIQLTIFDLTALFDRCEGIVREIASYIPWKEDKDESASE